jgi:hypothetical protein
MLETLQTIHGHWRWILLAVALIAGVKYLIGLVTNGKVGSLDKQLALGFAIAMTIQFVLGLVALIGKFANGLFIPGLHMEHLTYGLIATGLSHAIPMRKEARPDAARFRSGLIFIVISLVLVVFSVIRVRGGWVY